MSPTFHIGMACLIRRPTFLIELVRRVVGLVGKRAFVMTYEDGFKVTDREALAINAIDCEALMVRIVQAIL